VYTRESFTLTLNALAELMTESAETLMEFIDAHHEQAMMFRFLDASRRKDK